MSGLVAALGLFAGALALHLMVWRIGVPRRQTRTLLLLFISVLAGALAAILNWPRTVGIDLLAPWEIAQAAALYIALMLAYIATYSALEVDSPSLVMVREVFGAGAGGISRKEFERAMTAERLIDPRLQDMLRDGLVLYRQGRLVITRKGCIVARGFEVYRRLCRIEGAGG